MSITIGTKTARLIVLMGTAMAAANLAYICIELAGRPFGLFHIGALVLGGWLLGKVWS